MNRISKKPKTSMSIDPASLTRSGLAHQALSIVLQQWMVPDLGWNTQHYESSLPALREELIERRFKDSGLEVEQMQDAKAELRSHFDNEVGYFDDTLIDTLYDEVFDEDLPARMLQQISPTVLAEQQHFSYSVEQIEKACLQRFEKYFISQSTMLRHTTMTYSIELYQEYIHLYHKMVKVFSTQQLIYAHSEGGLIVHQLVAWQSLKERLKLLELVLLNFAFVPLTLEAEAEHMKLEMSGALYRPGAFVNEAEAIEDFAAAMKVCQSIFPSVSRYSIIDGVVASCLNMMGSIAAHIDRFQFADSNKRLLQSTRESMANERRRTMHTLCRQLLTMKHGIDYNASESFKPVETMDTITENHSTNLQALSWLWEQCLLHKLFLDMEYVINDETNCEAIAVNHTIFRYMNVTFANIVTDFLFIQVDDEQRLMNHQHKSALNHLYIAMGMKHYVVKYGRDRFTTNCVKHYLHVLFKTRTAFSLTESNRTRHLVDTVENNMHLVEDEENRELVAHRRIYLLWENVSKVYIMLEDHLTSSTDFSSNMLQSNDIDMNYLASSTSCPMMKYFTCPDIASYDDAFAFSTHDLLSLMTNAYSTNLLMPSSIVEMVDILTYVVNSVTHIEALSPGQEMETLRMAHSLVDLMNRLNTNIKLYSSNDPRRLSNIQVLEILDKIDEICIKRWVVGLRSNDFDLGNAPTTLSQALFIIHMKLATIQLWQMRAHIMVNELNTRSQDEIIRRVKEIVVPIITIVDFVPIESLAKTIDSVRRQSPSDNASQSIQATSNIVLFQQYLFWLEKALEVVLICCELCEDVKTIGVSGLSLSSTFVANMLLPRIGWVAQEVQTVIPLYSIFQSHLYNEQQSAQDNIEWLLASSSSHALHQMFSENITTATQSLQCISKLWKEECKRLGEEVLQKNIVELSEIEPIKSYALFN